LSLLSEPEPGQIFKADVGGLTVATPLQRNPQLVSLLRRLQEVPPWALLSLVMNGLLFITVLVVLRQLSHASDAVLPQANAYASDQQVEAKPNFDQQLGERHTLEYQQWVALLQAEAHAAGAINADRQNVLLGDSITLWFPPEMLPGRKTWLNQAISGENSGGLLNRLYILDDNEVETFFIMVGINDLIWGGKDEDLAYNIRSMINYLQEQHPDTKIVVQSILPHGGESASWEGRDKLKEIPPSRIKAVNEDLKLIAAELNADYLDLFDLFANGEGFMKPDLTTDGLHLNEDGYLVWRTAIALFNKGQLEP
jgi:lysophospholipase L1-like esterase